MTLTKADIVKSIESQTGFTENQLFEIVETLLEIIKNSLASGEDVLLTGFGKFSVREKNARRGRNPATGEDLMLGSKRIVTFKCSPVLRDKVNGEG